MEIRRKESCKDEKAALKFGGIAENMFLCGVKTSVLATPLSAGSKTLSPLLHLKATFQGRLLFFISLSEDAVEIWITSQAAFDSYGFVTLKYQDLNINTIDLLVKVVKVVKMVKMSKSIRDSVICSL